MRCSSSPLRLDLEAERLLGLDDLDGHLVVREGLAQGEDEYEDVGRGQGQGVYDDEGEGEYEGEGDEANDEADDEADNARVGVVLVPAQGDTVYKAGDPWPQAAPSTRGRGQRRGRQRQQGR